MNILFDHEAIPMGFETLGARSVCELTENHEAIPMGFETECIDQPEYGIYHEAIPMGFETAIIEKH